MYCEGCGAELPADARFCERCGRPVEAERKPETASKVAEVATVPVDRGVSDASQPVVGGGGRHEETAGAAPATEEVVAVPNDTSSGRSVRRRKPIVLVAIGVLLLVAAAGAGAIAAKRTSTEATVDAVRTGDSAAETREGEGHLRGDADAGAQPASREEEPSAAGGATESDEPPRADADDVREEEPSPSATRIPDLSDDETYYRFSKFLSNFSESGLWVGSTEEDAREVRRFDRDDPDFSRMHAFLFLNSHQNGGTLIDYKLPGVGGGCFLMPWSSVDFMTRLFFGRTYPHEAFPEGRPSDPDRVEEGLLAYTTAPPEQYGPTTVRSVSDAGDGLVRVEFDTYGLPLFDQGLGASPYRSLNSSGAEYSDDVYRVRPEDMCQYLGTDEPSARGTALLECARDGAGWKLSLVSYELDGPCLSRKPQSLA